MIHLVSFPAHRETLRSIFLHLPFILIHLIKVIGSMKKLIEAEPLARIDYVKIVDCATMQQITTLDRPALCAIAVYIGSTRLIDNFFTEDV